ncbi:7-cyano-7-deazaguanine synthase QueC [bacterium]|nr:7-cyano-7-deazaguanine synthase QueC [bacterium]
MTPKAVILLSGGIDSSTTLAIAREQGFSLYALSIDYGQRHKIELESAKKIARAMSVERHLVLKQDLTAIGGSSLTSNRPVPKNRTGDEIGRGIPSTYVPARNSILLSLALAWAEVLGSSDIFIGVNSLDYSGYPDCRPEFIRAFESMARLATAAGAAGGRLTVHAPLIRMTKAEIIRKGFDLGVDFSMTLSCYDPDEKGRPCGSCDSCLLRKKGFREAGIEDPVPSPPGGLFP